MHVKLLIQLSWRNIWRYRRRNGMLLVAIFVAVAGIVLTNAIIRGYQYDMVDDAVMNLTGHVKVLAPGYQEDPSIQKSFSLPSDWKPGVPTSEVEGWTSRINIPAVIMSERETRGIQLLGVYPAREREISFLGKADITGDYLSGPEDHRILIGKALAEQLETDIGRRLVVITQGADGLNREVGFRIAGLFDAEGTMLEKLFVFTGITTLQKVLDTRAVTEVSVRLQSDSETPSVEQEMTKEFNKLDVLDWRKLQPQAAAMFEYANGAILVWFLIMMLALAFGLINTLITAVMERVRELGMLRALGMRAGYVVAQVVIESELIVLLGLVLGIVAGVGLVHYFSDGIDLSRWAAGVEMAGIRSVLVPRLRTEDLVLVSGLSLLFGIVASLYPAWRAVKIKPLDALRR